MPPHRRLTRGRPSAPHRAPTIRAAPPRPYRCSSVRSRSIRTLRSRMRGSGSTTATSESRRCRARARSRRYRLRDRASDVERFYIDTFYDRQVTGNVERQQQTMESWARTYPRDPVPHGLLAGFATSSTGRYELSIAAVDKALALDPDQSAVQLTAKATQPDSSESAGRCRGHASSGDRKQPSNIPSFCWFSTSLPS